MKRHDVTAPLSPLMPFVSLKRTATTAVSTGRRRAGLTLIALYAALAIAPAGMVRAEDSAVDEDKAERCIPLRSIKQTKVLDDQNVIFYTNNNRNYKNHLPNVCSGLAIADTFMYRTSLSKLCNVDVITVLNRMGSSFTPGPSCGLGVFEPLDQQQLDALTNRKPQNP